MSLPNITLSIELSKVFKEPALIIQCNNCIAQYVQFVKSNNFNIYSEDILTNKFSLKLTEDTLVKVLEFVRKSKIQHTVSRELLDYENIIRSWDIAEITAQFALSPTASYYQLLIDDIGADQLGNQLIIKDRSNRYNYVFEHNQTSDALSEQIAFRKNNTIWIDSNVHTISQLIAALVELKRLPVLIVFDNHTSQGFAESLELISDAGISQQLSNVSVYFRLPNDDSGRTFNELVAKKQYNQPLQPNTAIAVIRNGNLPKCIFKSGWTPKSVIFLNHGIPINKTAVYTKGICDLIMIFSAIKPLYLNTLWK